MYFYYSLDGVMGLPLAVLKCRTPSRISWDIVTDYSITLSKEVGGLLTSIISTSPINRLK